MSSSRGFKKPSTPTTSNASKFLEPTIPAPTSNKTFKKSSASNNPNASICVGPTGASSGLRARRDLNETLPNFSSTIKKPLLQSKTSNEDENADVELTFAYNEYLQSCMRQLIIKQVLKKNKEVVDGQIQHYACLLSAKQSTLRKVHEDTLNLEKQQKVAEEVKNLEEVINKLKVLYDGTQIHLHLEKFRDMLQEQCQKMFFKNVKPIKNQEDFDRFMDTMKTLVSTMEKFVNSGRDFVRVHEYAETIRRFLENREKFQAAKEETLRVEKESITKVISTLSDIFARKYEEFDNKRGDDSKDNTVKL